MFSFVWKFFLGREKRIRRWVAALTLTGLFAIHVLKPGGRIEVIIRPLTGVGVLAIFFFLFLDEHRASLEKPRSATVRNVEKYVAIALLGLIGLALIWLLL